MANSPSLTRRGKVMKTIPSLSAFSASGGRGGSGQTDRIDPARSRTTIDRLDREIVDDIAAQRYSLRGTRDDGALYQKAFSYAPRTQQKGRRNHARAVRSTLLRLLQELETCGADLSNENVGRCWTDHASERLERR